MPPKFVRWVCLFAIFKLRFKHIAGKDNVLADALSRAFHDEGFTLPLSNKSSDNFPAVDVPASQILEWLHTTRKALGVHQKHEDTNVSLKTLHVRLTTLCSFTEDTAAPFQHANRQPSKSYADVADYILTRNNHVNSLSTAPQPHTQTMHLKLFQTAAQLVTTPNHDKQSKPQAQTSPTTSVNSTDTEINQKPNSSHCTSKDDSDVNPNSLIPNYSARLNAETIVKDLKEWLSTTDNQPPPQPLQDYDNEWTGENKYSKGFCYFVSDVNRAGDTGSDIDQSRYYSANVYKVLSVILSGTEDNYDVIRNLSHALIKKNADIFETFSNKGPIEAVINAGRISQSTKEEISAIASLIKCPIGLSYEDYSLVFYPSVTSDPKFEIAPYGTIIMLRIDKSGLFQWINQTLRKAPTHDDDSALKANISQQQALAELMALYKTDMPEMSSFIDDSPIDIQLTDDQAQAFDYDGIATQPMKLNTTTTRDYFFRHKRRPEDTKQPDRKQARPRDKLPFF